MSISDFVGVDGSRREAIENLREFLGPNSAYVAFRLIGPYKVGKTRVLHYVFSSLSIVEEDRARIRVDKVIKTDIGQRLQKWIVDWFISEAEARAWAQQIPSQLSGEWDWWWLAKLTEYQYLRTDSAKEEVVEGLDELLRQYRADGDFRQLARNAIGARLRRPINSLPMLSGDLREVLHNLSADDLRGLLQELRVFLARKHGIDQLLNDLDEAYRSAADGSLSSSMMQFAKCWQEMKQPSNTKPFVFIIEGQYVPRTDDCIQYMFGTPVFHPKLPNRNHRPVRCVFEMREPYEGPEQRQRSRPTQGSLESWGEDKEISGVEQKPLLKPGCVIDALKLTEARRLAEGNCFDCSAEHVLDQVGYHPGLLQIVCRGLETDCTNQRDAEYCHQCWNRRLREICPHVHRLLSENEKAAIRNAAFTEREEILDRLRGKGAVL